MSTHKPPIEECFTCSMLRDNPSEGLRECAALKEVHPPYPGPGCWVKRLVVKHGYQIMGRGDGEEGEAGSLKFKTAKGGR